MKEILGIFAAIAAVAGIASAVSKDEEKAQTEQQKLELEQQRMKMEQQRIQMEQDKQEYQRKLENAPKKAVYKPVSLQCSLCMGRRTIDEAAGMVKCPFCGATEMLTIDHYEVDQEAFQSQLQEEEQTRIKAAAEKQRKQNYDTAITFVAILNFIMLIVLINSPFIGTLLFLPSFIFLCLLLYHRFPETGKKVWTVIKFPLVCILLFPLPLTAFFMNSEKCQKRFSKNARICMSVGVWTLYAALICILGGMYINGFQKELHSDDNTTAQVTEDTKPTTVRTTKTTVATVVTTTTTKTNSQFQFPSSEKKRIDSFDSENNIALELGVATVEIPNTWTRIKLEEDDPDEMILFYDNGSAIKYGELFLTYYDLSEEPMSKDDFNKEKSDLLSTRVHAGMDFKKENSFAQEFTVKKRDAIYGAASGTMLGTKMDLPVEMYVAIIFDEPSQQLYEITLLEFNNAEYTHWNDYKKIVESIRFESDSSEEMQASETTALTEPAAETTTSVETTTEPKSEIYPQEDAFRAAVVAITNALATDVFTGDGSRHDTSKYHSYSDTSAFYMSVLSQGTWTEKNSNTWHVDGLRLQPDGYDTVFNMPINYDTVAKVSLDVTFDGNNYVISHISGMYAIPGKEDIGTNLSYLNSDSMSKSALTVSPGMIQNGR